MEQIFDLDNKFRKPVNVKTHSASLQFELINLGTGVEPKYVNLGKCCSPGERSKSINLFRQYKYVLSWTYKDLKMYETKIIQHVILIKVGVKPYQQPLRKMHPKLEPLIQSEVKNMLDAKVIFKVRHSEWVSNLVPVRKNSGEIRLCIDFINRNRASDKDNYHVPPMEQILQMVSSSELFLLLDIFYGYNQVLLAEEYRLKTTFKTKWGTFAYRRIPFRLINAGATF